MKAHQKLLIGGTAALTLLLSGCSGTYLTGAYDCPYIGDFGPYYSGYGPFYENDFVVGGVRYPNHYSVHHFYGQSFGARHFAVARGPGGGFGGHARGGGGRR